MGSFFGNIFVSPIATNCTAEYVLLTLLRIAKYMAWQKIGRENHTILKSYYAAPMTSVHCMCMCVCVYTRKKSVIDLTFTEIVEQL